MERQGDEIILSGPEAWALSLDRRVAVGDVHDALGWLASTAELMTAGGQELSQVSADKQQVARELLTMAGKIHSGAAELMRLAGSDLPDRHS